MLHLINYKEVTYFRTFFLNSIITAIAATIAVETSYISKRIFQDSTDYTLGSKKDLTLIHQLKEASKTFLVTFIATFLAYYLIHIITGYGNSMLHTSVSDLEIFN